MVSPAWLLSALRPVIVIVVCMLLVGCNDTSGFSIVDFRASVDVAADGSAVVSEELTLRVSQQSNHGGVYFDVPLAFIDQAGVRRKCGFRLLEAVHQAGEGYYTNSRTWDGRTIYVGDKGCKRCAKDLPVGENSFHLSYRLDRLVEERDGKQVLRLPVYLSGISELDGPKTASFRFPAGGKILGSGLPRSQYKIIEYTPRSLGIWIKPNAVGSPMADLEVEFPAGTFDLSSSTNEVVRWWVEDHLSKALIGASLIVTLVYSGLALRSLQVEKRTASADLDPEIVDRISPGLAAYIVHDKVAGAMSLGFKGSVYADRIEKTKRMQKAYKVCFPAEDASRPPRLFSFCTSDVKIGSNSRKALSIPKGVSFLGYLFSRPSTALTDAGISRLDFLDGFNPVGKTILA